MLPGFFEGVKKPPEPMPMIDSSGLGGCELPDQLAERPKTYF